MALAGPVTTRVTRHYSWSLSFIRVNELWQWQLCADAVEQNSDVRRVHDTRQLGRIFPNIPISTYEGVTHLGPFSDCRKLLQLLLWSGRGVRGLSIVLVD